MPKKKGPARLKSYVVNVINPEDDQIQCFSYETDNDELPFITIMNGITFDESEKGKKFDANFISIYNKERDDFDYYVERLVGISVENNEKPEEGKMWVPFINNRIENWSYICENNRIVAKEDQVEWRFIKVHTFNLNGLDA